jgi:hypothetical protein
MRFDNEDGKKALNLLTARVSCKLAEVHRLLAPHLEAPYTPAQLLDAAEQHLASLPPVQQEKVRMKAVVAYAELEQLIAEMTHCVAGLGDELQAVRVRTRAANAYRRAPRAGHYAINANAI